MNHSTHRREFRDVIITIILTLVLTSAVVAQERHQPPPGAAAVSEMKTATAATATSVSAAAAVKKVAVSGVAVSGCVGAVTISARGMDHNLAWTKTRNHWEDAVAKSFGSVYEKWNNAKNAVDTCHRIGFGSWSCDFTGEPCTPGANTVNIPPPGGPECFDRLTVTGGEGVLQSGAETKARNEWQRVAGITYGDAFRAWTKATEPTLSCKHNGLGAGQRRWECTASGKPCK
jgi:uncharacterized protein YukE